jgi:hypothetical protein
LPASGVVIQGALVAKVRPPKLTTGPVNAPA